MAGLFGDEGDRFERLALLPHPRGMLASEGRGSVMLPGIDWADWIAPQWLAALSQGVQAPRAAYSGADVDPRDALNVALNAMGGGMLTGRGAGGAGMNVFHTGPRKITSVDPTKLQARDSGFYGKGFYTSELPNYGYGGIVSKFDIPDEVILNAGISPQANPVLAEKVSAWYFKKHQAAAEARGRIAQLRYEQGMIEKSPASYAHAVNDWAVEHGYKAVRFGPGEIVVKDPSALKPIPFKKER